MTPDKARFSQAVTEAANRAEATALLIRCGYRVYRPEADIEGEDMVVRCPQTKQLRSVQLKGRAVVDRRRYWGRGIWMLFPSASYKPSITRQWFILPHDDLYGWVEHRHGHTPKWGQHWSYPTISEDLRTFLAGRELIAPVENSAKAENLN